MSRMVLSVIFNPKVEALKLGMGQNGLRRKMFSPRLIIIKQ